ncbi:MAG: heavy-metal-associated domain-containing protein [Gemmatimonadaceae bacterium]
MQQTTMAIAGMSCGGCVSAVQKALRAVRGARVDDVTVGSATVSYDASLTNPAALAQAVRDAGYRPLGAAIPVAAGSTGADGGCCGGSSKQAEAAAADQ